jgi:hypothetical protein
MKNEAIANQAQQPTNKVNSTNVMPTTTATVADGKIRHMDNHHIVAIFP